MQSAHCPKALPSPALCHPVWGPPFCAQPSPTPLAVPEDEQCPNCPSQKEVGTARLRWLFQPEGEEMGQDRPAGLPGKPHRGRSALFLRLKAPALNCPAGTHGLSGLLIGEPRALHNTASEPRNWFPELRSLTLLRLCARARRKRTLPTPHPQPPGPQATWGPMT